MRIRLETYSNEWHHGRAPDGRAPGYGPCILVEQSEDLGVSLTIEPAHKGETVDDLDIWRSLESDEARELAAALNHHADMSDRRAGLRI